MKKRSAAALLVLAIGCRNHPHDERPDRVLPPAVTPGTKPPPDVAAPRCGDANTTFTDAAVLPADASLIALLTPGAADLDAALAQLQTHVRGGTSGLAVPTAFALGQWRWEVPLVVRTLEGLGVATPTLAAIQIAGLRVWATPLGCEFDQLVARLQRDFEVRDLGGAAIATPRDRTKFAHDLIVRADTVVLCPAQAARRVLAAWDRPPIGSAAPSLRQSAFGLASAAVRIAIRETGLLDAGTSDSATHEHLIRVDASGVDATLAQ